MELPERHRERIEEEHRNRNQEAGHQADELLPFTGDQDEQSAVEQNPLDEHGDCAQTGGVTIEGWVPR